MVFSGTLVVVAFALSVWITRRCLIPDSFLYVLDRPTDRSLHDRPTPRSGGIAVAAGIVAGVGGFIVLHGDSNRGLMFVAIALAIVSGVGALDDRRPQSPWMRLVLQAAAAILTMLGGFVVVVIELPGLTWLVSSTLGFAITAFFIVWMINVFNFMDGMDGLASGMAVIGFGTLSILGGMHGHVSYSTINLVIASAAAGFLVFNLPPAKIFMGDVGSYTLGLLTAASSIWGVCESIFPLWIPLLTFSPFSVDATITVIRRALGGEPIFQAHCDHYYQRLARRRIGHRRVLAFEYAVMTGVAVSTLVVANATTAWQWMVIMGWLTFYIWAAIWITRSKHKVTFASET